ncbi:MAG: DNA primase [Anaerolineaceae bacterium]|nr:DNA primase [Anaerolineaceae bacterium]
MSVIDDIKAQLDIVDFVSQSGVKLRRTGKNHIGFCPFHANTRTPAFVVFPDSQSWRCFGQCNEGGDIFGFVMKKEGWDFSETLKYLADKAGVVLKPLTPETEAQQEVNANLSQMLEACVDYYRQQMLETKAGKEALDYLRKRGLTDESIKIWGLGYAPGGWNELLDHLRRKGYSEGLMLASGMLSEGEEGHVYDKFRNRLMFPIRDTYGKMVGFGGRVLDPNDVPKYMNSPKTELFDKGRLLYGLDLARQSIRRNEQVVIVEGYMDVIGLHQAGFDNAVSGMGTALTEDQFKLIKKFTRNIVLALDPDAAGEKATLKGLETARQSMDQESELRFDSRGLLHTESRLSADIRVTTLPDGKDPDEIALEDAEAWKRIMNEAQPVVVHVMHSLMAGKDINDAKVKRSIAEQVLPLIADVPNPVERESYRQTLARELRIDERSLTLKIANSPASRRRMQASGDMLPSRKLQKAGRFEGNRALELHAVLYMIENPERRYKLDQALAKYEIPLLSTADFSEADCREAFRIINASLAQDEVSAKDYLAAHLPDILEPVRERDLPETTLQPSEEKELRDQVRNLLRLRRTMAENRLQDLLFLQESEDEKPYSNEEYQILLLEQLDLRRKIDFACQEDEPVRKVNHYRLPELKPSTRKK